MQFCNLLHKNILKSDFLKCVFFILFFYVVITIVIIILYTVLVKRLNTVCRIRQEKCVFLCNIPKGVKTDVF